MEPLDIKVVSTGWKIIKKAAWYKVMWCHFWHTPVTKIIELENYFIAKKVTGCPKCDIWSIEEE